MNKTRVFFVVDSIEDNEEIFETLEQAQNWKAQLKKKDRPRLYIAIVKNAYLEEVEDIDRELLDEPTWNYEDKVNTFEIIDFIE